MRDLCDHEQAVAFRLSHLPLPPDAIECETWQRHGDDEWRRGFLIREWEVAGLWVSVVGEQRRNGDIRRWMHIGGEDECNTSDRQQLIAAIREAGQLLDSLT